MGRSWDSCNRNKKSNSELNTIVDDRFAAVLRVVTQVRTETALSRHNPCSSIHNTHRGHYFTLLLLQYLTIVEIDIGNRTTILNLFNTTTIIS